jgi:hypothetical protein
MHEEQHLLEVFLWKAYKVFQIFGDFLEGKYIKTVCMNIHSIAITKHAESTQN